MNEELVFKYLDGELDGKQSKRVEKKFKEEIQFYRELLTILKRLPRYPVPEEIWKEIDKKIERKRKVIKYTAAASIFLSLILSGIFFLSTLRKNEENLKKKEVEMVVESWERSLKEFEYFEKKHPEYSKLLERAKRKIIIKGEKTLQALEASWRR